MFLPTSASEPARLSILAMVALGLGIFSVLWHSMIAFGIIVVFYPTLDVPIVANYLLLAVGPLTAVGAIFCGVIAAITKRKEIPSSNRLFALTGLITGIFGFMINAC